MGFYKVSKTAVLLYWNSKEFYILFWNKIFLATELHRYGGGLVDESRDSTSAPPDSKQGGVPSKPPSDAVVALVTSVPLVASVPHSDVYHAGVPSQRPTSVIQRPGQRTQKKWKGPDKISRIYGDWIDDIEWKLEIRHLEVLKKDDGHLNILL